MPTQAEYQKVKLCILDPLCHLYGAVINDYAADAIVEDLCEFSEAVLNEAMRSIRQNRKSTPAVAHILEACKEAKSRFSNPAKADQGSITDAYSKLREARDAIMNRCCHTAKEYSESFMFSNEIAQKAKLGGWEKSLRDFVYEAAYVQQQILENLPSIGWSSVRALGSYRRENVSVDERQKWFLNMCREAAADGHISVTIPVLWLEPPRKLEHQKAQEAA